MYQENKIRYYEKCFPTQLSIGTTFEEVISTALRNAIEKSQRQPYTKETNKDASKIIDEIDILYSLTELIQRDPNAKRFFPDPSIFY